MAAQKSVQELREELIFLESFEKVFPLPAADALNRADVMAAVHQDIEDAKPVPSAPGGTGSSSDAIVVPLDSDNLTPGMARLCQTIDGFVNEWRERKTQLSLQIKHKLTQLRFSDDLSELQDRIESELTDHKRFYEKAIDRPGLENLRREHNHALDRYQRLLKYIEFDGPSKLPAYWYYIILSLPLLGEAIINYQVLSSKFSEYTSAVLALVIAALIGYCGHHWAAWNKHRRSIRYNKDARPEREAGDFIRSGTTLMAVAALLMLSIMRFQDVYASVAFQSSASGNLDEVARMIQGTGDSSSAPLPAPGAVPNEQAAPRTPEFVFLDRVIEALPPVLVLLVGNLGLFVVGFGFSHVYHDPVPGLRQSKATFDKLDRKLYKETEADHHYYEANFSRISEKKKEIQQIIEQRNDEISELVAMQSKAERLDRVVRFSIIISELSVNFLKSYRIALLSQCEHKRTVGVPVQFGEKSLLRPEQYEDLDLRFSPDRVSTLLDAP